MRLDEVVLRALEREPARRYQQVSQVRTEVETIVQTPAEAPKLGAGAPPPRNIGSEVKAPAVGLMVAAGINIALMLVMIATILIRMGRRSIVGAGLIDLGSQHYFSLWNVLLVLIVGLPASVLILWGAIRMMQLRNRALSIAAAILAMIAAPGSIIGLPMGIWALVVLCRREVTEAFRNKSDAQWTSPPQTSGDATMSQRDQSRQAVKAPAIGLLVAAGINLAVFLLLVAIATYQGNLAEHQRFDAMGNVVEHSVVKLSWLHVFILLLPNVVILWGAIQMLQLRHRGLAITAAILALIALPGILIGLPMGIWALVVLSRRDVIDAFQAQRSSSPRKSYWFWPAAIGKAGAVVVALWALVRAWQIGFLGFAVIGLLTLVVGLCVRRPIWRRSLLAIAILVIAFTVYVLTETATRARQAAVSTNGAWLQRLPSGVTVELLGVSEHPSKGKPWWRPDGSPLQQAPYEKTTGEVFPQQQGLEFAIRLGKMPEALSGELFAFEPALTYAGHGGLNAEGKSIPNIRAVAAIVPSGLHTLTVKYGVASGPWDTVGSTKGEGSSSSSRAGGVSMAFSPAVEKDGAAVISIAHNISDKDVRVVAIDKKGQVIAARSSSGDSAGDVHQTTATFTGTRLADIKEFQLQARPYEWATFKNVSLERGQQTRVEAADGMEKLATQPASQPVSPPAADDADGWGKPGHDGLRIRLVLNSTDGRTPVLTGEDPAAAVELWNTSDKPVNIAEHNQFCGRLMVYDEWLIGLQMCVIYPDRGGMGMFHRADDTDQFWSSLDGFRGGAREIPAGEKALFKIRLHRLVDNEGKNLLSLRGNLRLKPYLFLRGQSGNLWQGMSVGNPVLLSISDERTGTAPQPATQPATHPAEAPQNKARREQAEDVARQVLSALMRNDLAAAKALCEGAAQGWKDETYGPPGRLKATLSPAGLNSQRLEIVGKAIREGYKSSPELLGQVVKTYLTDKEAVVIVPGEPKSWRCLTVTLRPDGAKWLVHDIQDAPAYIPMMVAFNEEKKYPASPEEPISPITHLQAVNLYKGAVADLDNGGFALASCFLPGGLTRTPVGPWDIGREAVSGRIIRADGVRLLSLDDAKDFVDACRLAAGRLDRLLINDQTFLPANTRFFCVATRTDGTAHHLAVVEALGQPDEQPMLVWTCRKVSWPALRPDLAERPSSQAALGSDVQMMTAMIQLYLVQHRDRLPGLDSKGQFDAKLFADQMTQKTSADGKVYGGKGKSEEYPFGPYLKHMFSNPFATAASGPDSVKGGPGKSPNDGTSGWWLDTKAWSISPNHLPSPQSQPKSAVSRTTQPATQPVTSPASQPVTRPAGGADEDRLKGEFCRLTTGGLQASGATTK